MGFCSGPGTVLRRRLTNQTGCLRSEIHVGREARAKDPRKRMTLLATPLEHPRYRLDRDDGAGGSNRCDSRPETLVERRPAKADILGKVEVLSTESEFAFLREGSRPPLKLEPRSLLRRPFTEVICGHCSRERRLFFHLRGASS